MSIHGVTGLSDPNGQGAIRVASTEVNSRAFRFARNACRAFWPNANQLRAMAKQFDQQMLSFSECMRAHGIADFPIPRNGGQLPPFSDNAPGDLNPTKVTFRHAEKACLDRLPPGGVKELAPVNGL
jgi:hypothetical protein